VRGGGGGGGCYRGIIGRDTAALLDQKGKSCVGKEGRHDEVY